MIGHLLLGLVFLASLLVLPAGAVYAFLVTRPDRTAHRTGDLLSAVVLVAGGAVLLLLAMAGGGVISAASAWLLAAGAIVGSIVTLRAVAISTEEPISTMQRFRGGLLTLGLLAVIATPAWWAVLDRLDSMARLTGWYYWGQIQQFIEVGGFPTSTFEWGVVTAAFDHHLGFTALGAATAEATGAATSLAGVHAIRLMAGLAMPGAAYIAVRAWRGGRGVGVGVALLFTALDVTGTKPIGFVPEGLGHILAALTIGLLYPALIERSRVAQGALLVGMVATSQVHGIAGTFLYLVVAGVLLAFVVLPGEARSARFRLAFTLGALSLVGALLVGATLGARASDAAILADVAELGEDGSDPTWEFVLWATRTRVLSETYEQPPPPGNGELLGRALTRGFIGIDWWVAAALLLGMAAAGVYGVARRDRDALFVLASVLLAVLFIIGAGIALSLPYETYVPRRTGVHRIAQLWSIPAFLLGGLLVDRLRHRNALAVFLAASTIVWLVAAGGVMEENRSQSTREQVSELEALPIPDGALVLTNGWTQGAIAGLTDGVGLLDGQAPYVNPELLPRSIEMLGDVREFFLRPRKSADVPGRYGATHVLVALEPEALGGARIYGISNARLDLTRTLTTVYRSDNYALYVVSG